MKSRRQHYKLGSRNTEQAWRIVPSFRIQLHHFLLEKQAPV
jgi:hypothetical protein